MIVTLNDITTETTPEVKVPSSPVADCDEGYPVGSRSPAIAVPVDPLVALAAKSFMEDEVPRTHGKHYSPKMYRDEPKHKSTFDIVKTRIKNRKLNKLSKKARRK